MMETGEKFCKTGAGSPDRTVRSWQAGHVHASLGPLPCQQAGSLADYVREDFNAVGLTCQGPGIWNFWCPEP